VDMVTCPTCQGRAVVPIDQVADLTAAELERQVRAGRQQLDVLERIASTPPPDMRAKP
jgi:hypothetical protein